MDKNPCLCCVFQPDVLVYGCHVFWSFDLSIPSPDRSYVFLRSWLFWSPSFTSIWVMWLLQNETKDQLCSTCRHGVHILPNTVTYLLIPGILVMNCWIVLHSLRMFLLIGEKNDPKCLNGHWEVYLHVIESFFFWCQGYSQEVDPICMRDLVGS